MAAPGARSRLALPLLVLCAALATAVYLLAGSELSLPVATDHAATPLAPPPALGDEPALAMPPIEHFSETVTRPLFMSTRRPPEPGAPEAPPPEAVRSAPLALELSGIVISPRERIALLVRARSREVIRVTEGEVVEDWVVSSIEPDRVILEQDGRQQELKLEDKARPSPERQERQRRPERQPEIRRGSAPPAELLRQGERSDSATPGSPPNGRPRPPPE